MNFFFKKVSLFLGISYLLMVTSCSNETIKTSDKLRVVTTTTILADMVENLAGNKLEIKNLMGVGVDPHLYQASAGDLVSMQNADIVIYHGIHLEGKMGDIFSSLSNQGKKVISAGDGIDPSLLLEWEEDSSVYDPHVWFDISLWKKATQQVAKGLIEADPENKDFYEANLESYLSSLNDLEDYTFARLKELSPSQRVLVTAHDAFSYFARAYGFEVESLQGISTDSEAGTADIRLLADTIQKKGVKVVFLESSIPPRSMQALQASLASRNWFVEIGNELYSDSIGNKGTIGGSYIGAFKYNLDSIIDSLKK